MLNECRDTTPAKTCTPLTFVSERSVRLNEGRDATPAKNQQYDELVPLGGGALNEVPGGNPAKTHIPTLRRHPLQNRSMRAGIQPRRQKQLTHGVGSEIAKRSMRAGIQPRKKPLLRSERVLADEALNEGRDTTPAKPPYL